MRSTLLGQLLSIHTAVVTGACGLLVLATGVGSAVLLRDGQNDQLVAETRESCQGIRSEEREGTLTPPEAADEFFGESHLEGFRYELLDREGRVAAERGAVGGWEDASFDVPADGMAYTPVETASGHSLRGLRASAVPCGAAYFVRVSTADVLMRAEVQRAAAVLLFALPLAALAGAFVGRSWFRRRLRPLQQLEDAAANSDARAEVTLRVDTKARELSRLQDAFNSLLSRLGDALAREKRFTQEASHELRTPLVIIRGRLERLEDDLSAHPREFEVVKSTLHEVDRLDRLVDALLVLARGESAPLPAEVVNLCDIARDAARRQEIADGAGAPTAVVDAPDEILVRGSEDLLARAVENLVENARKFSGAQGHIRLKVREKEGQAVLTVADDGPGIPEAERPRVFDRFFRAPTARDGIPGAGLGLAVARAIVLRHSGRIATGPSEMGGEEVKITLGMLEDSSPRSPGDTGGTDANSPRSAVGWTSTDGAPRLESGSPLGEARD